MKSGSSGRMSEIFEEMVEIPDEKTIKKSIYREQRGELNGLPTHRYPIYIDNLNGANDVPMVQECIHFTAVKQGGFSLQSESDHSKAIEKIESDQFKERQLDKEGKTEFDKIGTGSHKAKSEESTSLLNAENVKMGLRSALNLAESSVKGFTNFLGDKVKQARTPAQNLEHCFLYMPSSVQFTEGASWGAEELGGLGNLIKRTIRGEGTQSDRLKNFAGGVASKIAQTAAIGGAALAGGALGAIGAAGLTEGIGGGLRAAGRFVQNPYEEQLFNGIGFREFSFEFAFAPASEVEADEVAKIIEMFRLNSRPNFVGGVLGEGQYTFPNEFNIEFLMNQNGAFKPHFYIPAIYNCVCTSVATNYTPEGFWAALRDGRPVSYGLSLSFTETKKITQDDIAKGY